MLPKFVCLVRVLRIVPSVSARQARRVTKGRVLRPTHVTPPTVCSARLARCVSRVDALRPVKTPVIVHRRSFVLTAPVKIHRTYALASSVQPGPRVLWEHVSPTTSVLPIWIVPQGSRVTPPVVRISATWSTVQWASHVFRVCVCKIAATRMTVLLQMCVTTSVVPCPTTHVGA